MSVPEIVCLFCHLRQPNAWDCAHCGRPLHERGTAQGLETPTLPELELHSWSSPSTVAVQSIDGFEVTALVDGEQPPVVAVTTIEGLEPTLADDPGEVAADLSIELLPTRVSEPEAPEPLGPDVCRYCGTPRPVGASVFCARCGMRGDR